ncbi:ABC transporter permease [Ruminococcus sp.]
MKHLISLSFKYIRRQKLRTFLTFMCIMLSAFILATVCVYGSSFYTTEYNYAADENGLWELEISAWTGYDEKAIETAKNHAVVSDYYLSRFEEIHFSGAFTESGQGRLGKFKISDGKNSYTTGSLSVDKREGNTDLLPSRDRQHSKVYKEEGAIVPYIFRNMGYSEGDTLNLTITPFTAVYDETSDIMKEIRAELKEQNGTVLTPGEKGFDDLPKDIKKKARYSNISDLLQQKGVSMQDTPLADIQYGEPLELSFKISGFANKSLYGDYEYYFTITNGTKTNISLTDILKNNPELAYGGNSSLYIRLIDNFDYDEALKMLFTDLGYDYSTKFYEMPVETNELLLALELKSAYAVYKVMFIIIVPALLVLLIAWFISRFVIDNTFEMAVQERSTHFAALRIIGASKLQIAAVVFIEALFYCFTAVPLGIISAVLLCKASFTAFRRSGLDMFEFSAKPFFIFLAAFLVVIAIFISAYTSAMWAARKLSPAEALNFGKPRSSKRKLRKRKSKLYLSAKKFLSRYTRKNKGAAKGRFVVSTITMALGVLMFTMTSLILLFEALEFLNMNKKYNIEDSIVDFQVLDFASNDPASDADKYFDDPEIFSNYKLYGQISYNLSTEEGSDRLAAEKLCIGGQKSLSNCFLHAIDENSYKKLELDTLTGMSYQEFEDRDEALFNNSVYGTIEEWEYIDDYTLKEKRERSYTALKKGCDLVLGNSQRIHITGIVVTSDTPYSIIIPLKSSVDYNMRYYIDLTVNGLKHYDEALERFEDFRNNESYSYAYNGFTYNTGRFSFIGAIVKVVLIFLVSIWLVGILSMINSVNTSVLNRSRELMMLRSVGMTRKQLRRSVLLETVMFSATAAVSGTIIGVVISVILLKSYRAPIPTAMTMILTVIAASVTANILIAILSALPAIRSLGRVESIAQAANE